MTCTSWARPRRCASSSCWRAPPELRFVLATRHDLRLRLHRLRLEGELTEIRADDLRFTLDEARGLFDTAGVQLPGPVLALLLERTEGWVAGLRLAALWLAGHPDPERFAAEFSGSERTVADYLLAEVLERQPEQVRRLLLRTSVLERVNGPLADLLTGGSGGERTLQDLEEADAFVMSVDAARSWFRYHQLFADLWSVRPGSPSDSELGFGPRLIRSGRVSRRQEAMPPGVTGRIFGARVSAACHGHRTGGR
jgi:LuxR family transcriptional regulator, maltose regulon positive regulatory protein